MSCKKTENIQAFFFFFSMCPGHEPGMGTEQKPSWDKQGVVLSLTDVRQVPPIRCHSTQVRDILILLNQYFRLKDTNSLVISEWRKTCQEREQPEKRRRPIDLQNN